MTLFLGSLSQQTAEEQKGHCVGESGQLDGFKNLMLGERK